MKINQQSCRAFFEEHRRLIIEVAIILLILVAGYVVIEYRTASQFQVFYSLETKHNDQEIINVINDADKYVYFAIYYFSKKNIADALIKAKKRGLVVEGIMDREASLGNNKSVWQALTDAGVSMKTQKHPDGIMHIKAVVTDKAYASGSYNWTASATTANDEVLEVGTNESVRKRYLEIIKKVIATGGQAAVSRPAFGVTPEYDFKEASDHIGEQAIVKGTVLKVFTAKSGVTFFDFCAEFKSCPFSAVIFASDLTKFGDIKKYQREVKISGLIKSYNGKAEIILDDPGQVD